MPRYIVSSVFKMVLGVFLPVLRSRELNFRCAILNFKYAYSRNIAQYKQYIDRI